jgi:kinesin family protein C1
MVEELEAAGELRIAEYEEKVANLENSLKNAHEDVEAREQDIITLQSELLASEQGRHKAEKAAAEAELEAEVEARNAQEAEVQRNVQAQKYESACGTIEKLHHCREVAEANQARAEQMAEKWKLEVANLQALRKKLHNELIDLKGNIRVFTRIRPSKKQLAGKPETAADEGGLVVDKNPANSSGEVIELFDHAPVGTDSGLARYNDGKKLSFGFDKVYDGSSTQSEVYQEVQPLVQSALDGYSLCIFAYGQTGSGKTHTMIGDTEVGSTSSLAAADSDAGINRGIVYRACEQMFEDLNNCCSGSGSFDWSVTIEAVEIYNEKLRDLLPINTGKKNKQASFDTSSLDIRKSKEGRVYVEGLERHNVGTCDEAVGFLDKALQHRATKATKCNDQSSRSHCVLIVRFIKTDLVSGVVKEGALHFCDLAGSERLSKSGSGEDKALLREAQNINKSLACLGNTMTALVQQHSHVPFRDSKLTYLLQECFTGSGKSLLVCALSPEIDSIKESEGSLRFAQTVSKVTANNKNRCATCGEKCGEKKKASSEKKSGEKRQRSSSIY